MKELLLFPPQPITCGRTTSPSFACSPTPFASTLSPCGRRRNLRSLSKRSSSCWTKNYQRFEKRHVTRDRITIGGSYQLIGTYEASLSDNGESLVVYGDKSRHSRKEADMSKKKGTVIVTGASQGIGAGALRAFLDRGYNVVANSRNITKSGAFAESAQLALVDGNIGESPVAARVVET